MPRTRQSLIRAGVLGILIAALAGGAATPAFAFGPADGTVTPTTSGENPLTTVAAVCPAPSDTVTLSWTGIQSGAPVSYGPTPQVLDGAGEYSDGYFLESFFDRDTDATLTIECFDGVTSLGTDATLYHLPTTGATSATAASLGINQDIVATGNCGTATSIDALNVYAYQLPANTLIAGFPITVPYTNAANFAVTVGTGTALGVPVGDSVRVSVLCHATAPTAHTTSSRVSTTLMTLAVAPAGPAGSAAGNSLAATGTDLTLTALTAGVLFACAAALLLLRRRRVAR